MTMSLLYPCGKPCSTGTHNETVKRLILFSAVINGIMIETFFMIESRLLWDSIESKKSFTYAVTIVICKSRNLISSLGSAEFGPK